MAKSTKHKDAVKPFDEFRAPWETTDGSEAEIDKPKLKRYIYGLVTDKANAQDAREDALADLTAAETERDEAKAQADDATGAEAAKKVAKLERQVADLTAERDDLTAERDGLVAAKEEDDLRSEVLGDLDPKYAKYVQGKTREELEKSLEDVKKDFGLADGNDGDEEEDEPKVRTRPRSTSLRNPADKDSGRNVEDVDFDKVADEIIGAGVFR